MPDAMAFAGFEMPRPETPSETGGDNINIVIEDATGSKEPTIDRSKEPMVEHEGSRERPSKEATKEADSKHDVVKSLASQEDGSQVSIDLSSQKSKPANNLGATLGSDLMLNQHGEIGHHETSLSVRELRANEEELAKQESS